MNRWLVLLIALTCGGGLTAATAGLVRPTASDVGMLLLLIGLGILAERYAVDLYGSRISIGVATVLIAATVSGLWGVALVAPAVVLGGELRTDSEWYKRVFNMSVYVLAGATFAGVFRSFGIAAVPGEWPNVLAPTLLAGASSFVVNSSLVASAVAVSSRRSIARVWREQYLWILPQSLILSVSAVAAATGYAMMGLWGLFVFALPVVGTRQAYALVNHANEREPVASELKRAA